MIETLQDVEVVISTLTATNMIWHADDYAADCFTVTKMLTAENIASMQRMMNEAIEVCEQEDVSVFDFYNHFD